MPRKHTSLIINDEHATIGGVDGKKVFVIDNAGNQITDFGGETLPTAGNNPPLVLGYDGSNQLTTITQTVDGISYRKTLTWSGGVCTNVGAWVQL